MEDLITNFYIGKKILVTGSTGYIGSSFIEMLVGVDCTIVRLSRSRNKSFTTNTTIFVDHNTDIKDADWESLIENIDIVFYFSGQTSAHFSNEHPYDDLQINVIPFVKLLEAVRKHNQKTTVILAGSATEVGMTMSDVPISESIPDNPTTIYDINKLMAEKYLSMYCKKGLVRGCCLRLANVYGPGIATLADRGILNKFISRALDEKDLIVYGDGEFIRDYIYIDDVTEAFLHAGINQKSINGKYYYIGSGQGTTLAGAFNLIADYAKEKYKINIDVVHREIPDGLLEIEKRNFIADITLFKKDTSWIPKVDFNEGIKRTFNAKI